ncbi:ribonuclease E inhibitor RraB [Bhargavaea cecembensis]|uniref:ribonuclease E inhibitor RraB n=1 Tax=Bhargavaea cecembensis TaxID=394098 RepID=UPI000694C4BE|nr:ribonuclease E inhibitor RraB [Bhargavaea cecembensis]
MFPNDEDGQVLQMLKEEGVDFDIPQPVEFAVACPDKRRAKKILKAIKREGITAELDEDEGEWSCYAVVVTHLDHAAIVEMQERLDQIAAPFDGRSDGWGVMVIPED